MSEATSSYADIANPSTTEEVDSLPSSSAGSSTSVSPSEEAEESDAEREWRESLQQLELLLTMVLVPYLGRYFGRKCAYWGKWNILSTRVAIVLFIANIRSSLGQVDGAAVSRESGDHKPGGLQRCWCG